MNEEYEESWATQARGFRFGENTDSFAYRYFSSNLRLLQMRCSYVHNKDTIVPELLPFVALQLGRTVEDAPDIWCFMRESYLRMHGTVKNWSVGCISATLRASKQNPRSKFSSHTKCGWSMIISVTTISLAQVSGLVLPLMTVGPEALPSTLSRRRCDQSDLF